MMTPELTAFDTAWGFVKADQDFYVGGRNIPTRDEMTPMTLEQHDRYMDLSRKLAWLYNDPVPESLAEAREQDSERIRSNAAWAYNIGGQANTDYGVEDAVDWMGRPKYYSPYYDDDGNWITDHPIKDYDKPKRGPGRVLYNLPVAYKNVRDEANKKWESSDEGKEAMERYKKLPPRRKYGRFAKPRPKAPPVSDLDIIERIIELINHEVGHTTQQAEEEDWQKEDEKKYNYSGGRGGFENFNRNQLMQESLASIYEDPHDLNWRKRVAEYGGTLTDNHQLMRELSYGMAKFFDENPDAYRSPEKVREYEEWRDGVLARQDNKD
jgi:hypothetical protein